MDVLWLNCDNCIGPKQLLNRFVDVRPNVRIPLRFTMLKLCKWTITALEWKVLKHAWFHLYSLPTNITIEDVNPQWFIPTFRYVSHHQLVYILQFSSVDACTSADDATGVQWITLFFTYQLVSMHLHFDTYNYICYNTSNTTTTSLYTWKTTYLRYSRAVRSTEKFQKSNKITTFFDEQFTNKLMLSLLFISYTYTYTPASDTRISMLSKLSLRAEHERNFGVFFGRCKISSMNQGELPSKSSPNSTFIGRVLGFFYDWYSN